MAKKLHMVGPYRLEGEIGRGGMGIVYRAVDTRLGRVVAIKAMNRAASRQRAKRLQREACILASLNHPNIGAIYGIEADEEALYLVLEFVEGEPLRDRLRAGPLPQERAVSICAQVALGLEAAHARGIVHRGLKPMNVHITPQGRVKVLDFEIATRLDMDAEREDTGATIVAVRTGGRDETGEHGVHGTPWYLSPEQASGRPTGAGTDLWALGCILFECLSGHRPFEGDTTQTILERLYRDEPDYSLLPGNTAPRLLELMKRCLRKDPEDRPADMSEARRILSGGFAESIAVSPGTVVHLPNELTGFIGREDSMLELTGLLAANRMLTLTGAGGCGKSRLALRLAWDRAPEFTGGVWMIELAPLGASHLVPQEIANALGVRGLPRVDLLQSICEFFGDRTALLVLDNCDHLLSECGSVVTTLLRECPNLRVMATSREGLGIGGETIFRVLSLETPDPECLPATLDEFREIASVKLFLEAARAVRPDLKITEEHIPHLCQICCRLDGIPLALELAAARVRILSLEQIGLRLDDRFRLLTGGSRTVLPRQQTLRALIDWSYDQLHEDERQLLRALSVFRGGWTLEAAAAVCGRSDHDEFAVLESLTKLVDKSLVVAGETDHEVRYSMLETIRQYASDRLFETDEAAALRANHVRHFIALARSGGSLQETLRAQEWFDRVKRDEENFRDALSWCMGHPKLHDDGLELANLLFQYWASGGLSAEGHQYYEAAFAERPPTGSLLCAESLGCMGRLSLELGDFGAADEAFARALSIQEEIGDRSGIAMSKASLGVVLWRRGDLHAAGPPLEQALEIQRELGQREAFAMTLRSLAIVFYQRGDLDRAEELVDESIAVNRELGNQQRLSLSLQLAGILRLRNGDRLGARHHHELALELMRATGYLPGVAQQLVNIGNLEAASGNHGQAQTLLQKGLAVARKVGRKSSIVEALGSLGENASKSGEWRAALVLFQECVDLCRQIEDSIGIARCQDHMARLEMESDPPSAAARLDEALGLFHRSGNLHALDDCLQVCARVALRISRPALAANMLGAAEALWSQAELRRPARLLVPARARQIDIEKELGRDELVARTAEGHTTPIPDLGKLLVRASVRQRDPTGGLSSA